MSVAFALQEARVRYPGTTMPLAYTAGNNAAWTAATKIRIWGNRVALDGLTEDQPPANEVRTRYRSNPVGTKTPQGGSFTAKFPLNSQGGSGKDAIFTLLSKIFLGSATPTAVSAALNGGSHTVSLLNSTGIGAKISGRGTAVLAGTRGDGDGEGRVYGVQAEATDAITLAMDTVDVMQDSQVIYLSYTLYPSVTTAMQYLEWLLIGKSGRQLNCIACQATAVRLAGLGVVGGEEPVVEIDFQVGGWRWEPAASEATLQTTVEPSGPDAVQHKGEGALLISDAGYGTPGQNHGYLHAGGWSIDLGFGHKPIRSPLGVGGIAGYRPNPGVGIIGCNALIDEGTVNPIPQFVTDYDAKTEKQVMFQIGHTADACVALEFPRAIFNARPKPIEEDGDEAVKLSLHSHEDTGQAEGSLAASDWRMHFFKAS